MDIEPTLFSLSGPVLDDVEVAKVDVKVPTIEVEDSPPVHHLAPLEGTEYPTRPAQFLKRPRVDLPSVIDGKIPVAV
jgi:hypothetical protein